jgi:hypothetical protein
MAIQNFSIDLTTKRYVQSSDLNIGLREISLNEGTSYSGAINVYWNGTGLSPSSLILTLNNSNNTIIYSSGDTSSSGYALNVDGGSLRNDFCDSPTIDGLLSTKVTISGQTYPINPLNAQVIANTTEVEIFNGVNSINGQSGSLNLYGSGDITVFGSQQNIYVGYTGNTGQFAKSSETGVFATAANLLSTGQTLQSNLTGASGVLSNRLNITGSGLEGKITALSGTATTISGALKTTGAFLESKINAISGATGGFTGAFYPRTSNPAGYLTSLDTGSFITTSITGQYFASSGRLTTTGNSLQSQINAISGITGGFSNQFYPRLTNPSGYVMTGQTGIFATAANLALTGSNLQTQITNIVISSGFSIVKVNNSSSLPIANLTGRGNVTVSTGVSGIVFISGATGGFVDTAMLSSASGALSTRLAATGANLQSQINTISGITGTYTGMFYPRFSNPSGYITGLTTGSFISSSQTGVFATTGQLASTGSSLQTQVNSIVTASGNNLSTVRVTGSSGIKNVNLVGAGNVTVFLPSGNLSGNVIVSGNTGAYANFLTNGYVTGISGALQTQINTVNTWTGSTTGVYYPRFTNPSGFIWTGQTGAFAAAVLLESTGSNLQGQINSLSGNLTGSINLIPSTIRVSGSSFITGANFTGVVGAAVIHSGDTILVSGTIFNSGFFSGTLDKFFVHKTGDEALSGIKFFADRPYVGTGISGMISGTGVVLSGEATAVKITGSTTLDLANFTGIGGAQVILSGNSVLISGGASSSVGGAGSGVSLLVATGYSNSGGFTGNVLLSGAGGVVAFTGANRSIVISGTPAVGGVTSLAATGIINTGFFTGSVMLSGAGNIVVSTGNQVSKLIVVSGDTGAYTNFTSLQNQITSLSGAISGGSFVQITGLLITGVKNDINFFTPFPTTGLALQETFVSNVMFITGYAIGATSSGVGGAHQTSGASGAVLQYPCVGEFYQRTTGNSTGLISSFTFNSGLLFQKASIANFATASDARIGLNIFSGISGAQNMTFALYCIYSGV